ncbi:SH3 domain-containing protein [Lactiplantibacillus plantarum]|uniref:SH3 domain-containing protein n=1 Tax=Lactiplantibacillus plantarum TaxID=1590 RepID=UPI003965C04E
MKPKNTTVKHFKLYKSGKLWLVACLSTISTTGLLMQQTIVHADSASANQDVTENGSTDSEKASQAILHASITNKASQATSSSAVASSTSTTDKTSQATSSSAVATSASTTDKTSQATSSSAVATSASTTDKTSQATSSSAVATSASTTDKTSQATSSSAVESSTSTTDKTSQATSSSAVASSTSTTDKTSQATSSSAVSKAATHTMMKATRMLTTVKSTPQTPQEAFLAQIKAGAERGWYDYGILPSITAAQAIVESGWGQSELATTGNNLFGIKGSYQGKSILFPTQEWNGVQYITINDNFRQYDSWSDSVYDHGTFLNENSRYSNLRGVTDAATVAKLIRQDGYATAPTYTTTLLAVIKDNNLTAWDKEVTYTNWQNKTGNYKFTQATKIYNVPSTKGTVEGTYEVGESVLYNGEVNDNGNIWLRYLANSGALHYVQIATSSVTTSPKETDNKTTDKATTQQVSGRYTFTTNTAIRSAASQTAKQVGTYESGETVTYNAKVTIGQQTWLRYLSYSGQQHYVLLPTATKTATAKITKTFGTYKFTETSAVRNATTTTATQVATYYQGDSVNYNAKITIGQQTWLRYTSYNGANRYILLPTKTNTVVNKPKITTATGIYTFSQTTAIRSNASDSAKQQGTYYAGNTVSYNAKITVGAETWLRYTSYSGSQHYVKISSNATTKTNSTTSQAGWHTFTTTTNIRTAPTTTATVTGQYYAGEKVYYVGTVDANGYTWLKYMSSNGNYHYVAKF